MAVTWKKLAYEDDVITKALLTTKGDMIYASSAGVPARLPIGSNTHVLAVNVDVPYWTAAGTPGTHKTTHENGGADEISVAGLNGELADAQTPKTHATSHKNSGTDELLLSDLGEPTAAVKFDGQQATNFVLEVSASPPAVAVLGKIYFDTDLSAYICTAIA